MVLVLWLLLVLTAIGGSLLHEIRGERRSAATTIALLQGRLIADGAINRAILSLLDPSDPVRPAVGGPPLRLDLAGQPVAVRVESEAGKIDINAAPPSLLSAMFASAGLTAAEGDGMAARIAGWRARAGSPAADEATNLYHDAGLSYGPRRGPFRSVGELRLVLGMTDSLQRAIEPMITVYSHNSSVDLSVASEPVLACLEAAGSNFAAGQRAALARGAVATRARLPGIGEALTIIATADEVERRAVIQLGGDARRPYQILSWH